MRVGVASQLEAHPTFQLMKNSEDTIDARYKMQDARYESYHFAVDEVILKSLSKTLLFQTQIGII